MNYTDQYRTMIGQSGSYSFAITSINITYTLTVYFQLNTAPASPNYTVCSDTELLNFAKLLQQNGGAFGEFHYYAMVFVHNEWIR